MIYSWCVMAKEKENIFPLEEIPNIEKNPRDYCLLKRIPITTLSKDSTFPYVLNETLPDDIVQKIIILDTETTGLNIDSGDTIMELGMVRVSYSKNRSVFLNIEAIYDAYEDTDKEIPELVQIITGITKADIEGKAFDNEEVKNFITDGGKVTPLIIAHNASFDRPFFDQRFPELSELPWACSLKEIDWLSLDNSFTKSSLEFLSTEAGFFYDAHRADIDCLALLWLLHYIPDAFKSLRHHASQYTGRFVALNLPFDLKDKVKDLGFRWDSVDRVWYKEILETERAEYKAKMKELYGFASESADIYGKYDAFQRYKKYK